MSGASTISRLIRASSEGHNEERLCAEQDKLIAGLSMSVRERPDTLSPRLSRQIQTGQRLKILDVEDFIDALRQAAKDNPALQADLVSLELVAARVTAQPTHSG